MKKQILYFVTIILFIGINSCKKDNSDIPSDVNFIEVTIDGKKYNGDVGGMFGFTSQETCDNKLGYLINAGQVETSDFFLDLYLMHYENLDDFKSAEKGEYQVRNGYNFNGNTCNFEVEVSFDDNTESNYHTSLKTGGKNTITNIKKLGETSTDVEYAIQGTFSCVFINHSNKEISVTGKYNVITEVLK